jgi:hypothetical protein
MIEEFDQTLLNFLLEVIRSRNSEHTVTSAGTLL